MKGPTDKITLNRFPLLGLFAYRAARHTGYTEEDARLLGYSTALLYAIFKAKVQAKKEKPEEEAKIKELPKEIEAKIKTVVGHKIHGPEEYDSQVMARFPEGWHDRLAKAFDRYLAAHDSEEFNKGNVLFDLYKAWRDENKVGFNRIDLEKLTDWLEEHEEHAAEKSRR
jgi:hypothetical protein